MISLLVSLVMVFAANAMEQPVVQRKKPFGYDFCRSIYNNTIGIVFPLRGVNTNFRSYRPQPDGEHLHSPESINRLHIVEDGGDCLFHEQLWTQDVVKSVAMQGSPGIYTYVSAAKFRFDNDATWFRGETTDYLAKSKIMFDGTNKNGKGIISLSRDKDNVSISKIISFVTPKKTYFWNSYDRRFFAHDENFVYKQETFYPKTITSLAQDYHSDRYAAVFKEGSKQSLTIFEGDQKKTVDISSDSDIKKILFAGPDRLYALDKNGSIYKATFEKNKGTCELVKDIFPDQKLVVESIAIDPLHRDTMVIVGKKDNERSLWVTPEVGMQKAAKVKTITNKSINSETIKHLWVWDNRVGIQFDHNNTEGVPGLINIFDLPGKVDPRIVTMAKLLPHVGLCALGGALFVAKKVQEAIVTAH
jgi:hypothetical protein